MNEDREHSQPHMLTMHKNLAKTSDGTRPLIFYTFEESNSSRSETKEDRKGQTSEENE